MLIIFDVDGTLLGGETHDWASFATAITHHTGFVPTPEFWQSLDEITSQFIVHAVLGAKSEEEKKEMERLVRAMHLEGLRKAHQGDPKAFMPMLGAMELLQHLAAMEGVDVAIATGDWHPTISFKLAAAGFDVSSLPMATASDCMSRADIIALAASRAGRELHDVVYVGDGPWDLLACRKLGIPFIGTGNKIHRLLEAGAEHTVPDLSPSAFMTVLEKIQSAR